MRKSVLKFLVCTALGAGLASPALAQDEEGDDTLIVVTATGVTQAESGTKTSTSLIETPQSISVITREELDVRAVHTVTEALAYTAGVQSESSGIDSRVDDVRIRGFSAGSFSDNLFVDGLRVPSGGQWTRVTFDPFALQQVEVLKGPSAVLYGQVAPGGLVNLVTKRPTATLKGEFSAETAGFTTLDRWQYQASGDIGGPITGDGKLLGRVVGFYRSGDTQIETVQATRYYVSPSFTWAPDPDTSLTLYVQYQRDDGEATYQFLPATGTLYPGLNGLIGHDTYLGEPDYNTFDRDQQAAGWAFSHKFGDFLEFRQNGRFFHVDTLYEVTVLAGNTIGGPGGGTACTPAETLLGCAAGKSIRRRAVRGTGESDGYTIDTQMEANFDLGGMKHKLLVGFDSLYTEWEHYRDAATVVPPIFDIYKPVYGGSATIKATLAPQVHFDTTDQQAGLYFQDQVSIGDLRILVGGRQDWAWNSQRDVRPAVVATSRPVITRADAFTYRVGATYLFDFGLAPYASYSESFQPSTGTYYDGTPFLPTTGQQIEAGFKYQPPGVPAFITLGAYQLTQQNLTTPDSDPAHNVFCAPSACSTQTGEGQIKGVELEGKASLPFGLSLVGTATYMESEVTKTNTAAQLGKDLVQVPDWMASLFADYRFKGALDGLGIGGGVRYVGKTEGDALNTLHIPSYTLYDLFVRYQFKNGLIFSLNARNLTDELYVATCGSTASCFYGSGRTVNARIQFRF